MTSEQLLYYADHMRIGILSDTHLSHATEYFKEKTKELFDGIDILIHAGDMTGVHIFEYLAGRWDVRGVRGNMDDYELYSLLPEKRIEDIVGRKIGIIHGKGSPHGIEERVFSEFDSVDMIVFGHSHVPFEAVQNGTVLFNPGSFSRNRSGRGSAGIIEIGDTIRCLHVNTE